MACMHDVEGYCLRCAQDEFHKKRQERQARQDAQYRSASMAEALIEAFKRRVSERTKAD